MNAFLSRLTIAELSDDRLTLREIPRLDYGVMIALFTLSVIAAVMGFFLSSILAVVVGIIFGIRASVRYIIFDRDEDTMTVVKRSFLRQSIVEMLKFEDIQRVYLKLDDNESTQIVIVVNGEETGLSAYSRGGQEWKEDIVIKVNRFIWHDEDEES